MDILSLIVVGVLAFWAGMKVDFYIQSQVLRQILEDLNVTDKQLERLIAQSQAVIDGEEPKQDLTGPEYLEIKVEQFNDTLFAYRLADGRFLGQGQSREALINRLAEDLHNIKLVITEENGAQYLKQ